MSSAEKMAVSQTRDKGYLELIARLAQGDQHALTELYDLTSPLIFGLLLKILGDRSSAEEVLLDVYTQVWRQAARFDPARGGPLAWVITIARSRGIDRLRADHQHLRLDELTEVNAWQAATRSTPEDSTAASEMQRLVRSALDGLPREQLKVLELGYYSGMTQSEIALHLALPLGTVKTRMRLGMMKLREVLSPTLDYQL